MASVLIIAALFINLASHVCDAPHVFPGQTVSNVLSELGEPEKTFDYTGLSKTGFHRWLWRTETCSIKREFWVSLDVGMKVKKVEIMEGWTPLPPSIENGGREFKGLLK